MKGQSNERQSISEKADQSRSDQAYQSASGAIRVDHIRNGAIRLDQIYLKGVIRLEQSGVKASEKRCGRLERS